MSGVQRWAADGAMCVDVTGTGGEWIRYADHAAEVARLEALAADNAALQAALDRLHGSKFSDRNYHALKSRAEAAEADARRYRWLRESDDRAWNKGQPFIGRCHGGSFSRWNGEHADAAIDAQLAEVVGRGEGENG